MLEIGRERVDLEPRSGDRRPPRGPALGGRHLERRNGALGLCGRDGGIAAESGLKLPPVLSPHDDSGGADQFDDSGESL
jgi:hypothetical protein